MIIRYNEHVKAIKNNEPTKYSVAYYALDNLHFNFSPRNNLRIKKVINNTNLLDAYESYYIHKHNQSANNVRLMNTDQGNVTSYLFSIICNRISLVLLKMEDRSSEMHTNV